MGVSLCLISNHRSPKVPPPIKPEERKTHVSQSVAVILSQTKNPPEAAKIHNPNPTLRLSPRSRRLSRRLI